MIELVYDQIRFWNTRNIIQYLQLDNPFEPPPNRDKFTLIGSELLFVMSFPRSYLSTQFLEKEQGTDFAVFAIGVSIDEDCCTIDLNNLFFAADSLKPTRDKLRKDLYALVERKEGGE